MVGKWVKAGLEYTDGVTKRSVVIAGGGGSGGADWSVAPHDSQVPDGDGDGRVRATVEFEREGAGKELGGSLLIKVDGEVVRECTWVFTVGEIERLQVGVYGARPAVIGGIEDLDLRVEVFEVEEMK